MRIQVLDPTTHRPVPRNQVRRFLERGRIKDGLVLKVTPSKDHGLNIAQGDSENPLHLDSTVGIDSIGVSTHTDNGLIHFGITEKEKEAEPVSGRKPYKKRSHFKLA